VGGLELPEQGTIYLDTNSIIYSVECIEPYRTALQPLWEVAQAGKITIATSDLALLEVLVAPLRTGNKILEAGFSRFTPAFFRCTVDCYYPCHLRAGGTFKGDYDHQNT
jgi:hypothetical protein